MHLPLKPLLIHSLSEFRQLIDILIRMQNAKSVVEIGAEFGPITKSLIEMVEESQLERLHIIDPSPKQKLLDLLSLKKTNGINFIQQLSIQALPQIPPADIYIIDGDHNYYTVVTELEIISSSHLGEELPVIFLHDVCWPCGRRDQYHSPSQIPETFLHQHDFHKGITLGNQGMINGGFRSNGNFSIACKEGGPNNGVLTAAEEFMAKHPEYSMHIIPAVFGLAILTPVGSASERHLDSEGIKSLTPLLKNMEENRLQLYLHVIELQDKLVKFESQSIRQLLVRIFTLICQRFNFSKSP